MVILIIPVGYSTSYFDILYFKYYDIRLTTTTHLMLDGREVRESKKKIFYITIYIYSYIYSYIYIVIYIMFIRNKEEILTMTTLLISAMSCMV